MRADDVPPPRPSPAYILYRAQPLVGEMRDNPKGEDGTQAELQRSRVNSELDRLTPFRDLLCPCRSRLLRFRHGLTR
jgi:hypothetical protein